MSIWQLIHQKPSLAQLADCYPHLRRFIALGFETDFRFHKDDAVGLVNAHQRLRVNLTTGKVSPILAS